MLDLSRPTLSREAPEHGSDPGDQFAGTEGLGHIVIRPQAQAGQLVLVRGSGSEHNNRHIGFIPEPAADFKSIDAGQHEIQNDKVRVAFPGQAQGGNAVISRNYAVAIPVQVELDQFHCLNIIINHQNPFTRHLSFP